MSNAVYTGWGGGSTANGGGVFLFLVFARRAVTFISS